MAKICCGKYNLQKADILLRTGFDFKAMLHTKKLVGLDSHAHTHYLCVDKTNLYVKLGHVFTSTTARGIRQDMEGQQRKDYIVGFFSYPG